MPTPSKLHLDVAEKLKPCPFCGNKTPTLQSNGMRDFFVQYYAEDEGDVACGASSSDYKCETEEEAIKRWNTRFPDPQPSAVDANLLAALRKLLQTHSCDTGEADHRCEWGAKGENTLCEMCKPAYAAIAKATEEPK